jgi:hypothetical protein
LSLFGSLEEIYYHFKWDILNHLELVRIENNVVLGMRAWCETRAESKTQIFIIAPFEVLP